MDFRRERFGSQHLIAHRSVERECLSYNFQYLALRSDVIRCYLEKWIATYVRLDSLVDREGLKASTNRARRNPLLVPYRSAKIRSFDEDIGSRRAERDVAERGERNCA